MNEEPKEQPKRPEPPPYRFRLPGWLIKDKEVGLGDVVKRVTYRTGMN